MEDMTTTEDWSEEDQITPKASLSPRSPKEDYSQGADPFDAYLDPTDFGYYYGLPGNPKLLAKTNRNKGVQIAQTMLDGTGIYRVLGKRAYEVDARDPGRYKRKIEELFDICRTVSKKTCMVEFLRLGHEDHPAMNPRTFLITVEEGTSSTEAESIVQAIEKVLLGDTEIEVKEGDETTLSVHRNPFIPLEVQHVSSQEKIRDLQKTLHERQVLIHALRKVRAAKLPARSERRSALIQHSEGSKSNGKNKESKTQPQTLGLRDEEAMEVVVVASGISSNAMNALALRLPRAFPVHKTRPCDLLNHYSPRASIPSSTALTTFLTKRHASSSTTTSSPTTTNSLALVNGPSSTLPAPLTLPTRGKDQSLPSFYFATGKTYLAFYKTGVKNIYYNYRSSKPIQQRIDNTYKSSLSEAVAANGINRQEFQLLARNWHDVKRVPVFALVFAICGEFTPLVVVFLSSVVPWTCRIPSQIEGDRRKLESRRRISFRNLTLPPPEGIDGGVEKLARMQLIHISWSLGLSSSVWDWLGGQFPGLPSFMVRKKVDKRVEYLEMDDKLIKDAGGIGKMELEECKMACIERGIDVIGRKDTDIKQDLNDWLKSRPMRSIEHLLLTRPSVWPAKPQGKKAQPTEYKKVLV